MLIDVETTHDAAILLQELEIDFARGHEQSKG